MYNKLLDIILKSVVVRYQIAVRQSPKKIYWLLIKIQFVLCLFFYPIVEIFHKSYVFAGLMFIIFLIGALASRVARKFDKKKFLWSIGTLVFTIIDFVVVGFIFGSFITFLLGL
jgi:hypothetical protein